jgi:signal transduction histidine kinase/CheY-like chemotaxis protein
MMAWLRPATVRARLVAMALATTFAALLLCSGAMLLYDLSTFRQSWVDDMTTQAELLALASAPALNFNDAAAARQNLSMLQVRPQILAGAIYTADGRMFASYAQSAQQTPVFLERPGAPGHQIHDDRLQLFHTIIDHGEIVGTVYLEARYRLLERLRSYASILGAVMLCSLLLAALVAARLQRAITTPLAAVTDVAREVMQRRDFSLRVPAAASGEIGTLVDAFNAMLAEVGRRAGELQDANQTLEREMAVRAEAQRALLLADRRKDEFLATLAHELRNPLAPIRTGLDILRLNPGDAAGGQRARTIMERQMKQMVRLVDDLLDVSRINTGKLAIRNETVDLQAVVNDALDSVRPLIDLHGHTLEAGPLPRPLTLAGDPTRLAQILSNLLNNAAKYTARGGHITLTVEAAEHQVAIHVRDNGIGIAAAMLEPIFQMFVQADATLERTSAGLGVGLSLARRLAELHGGGLQAHSMGIGHGSEFVLTLPLPAQQPAPLTGQPATLAGSSIRRILLVDDNVDFVDSMGALLAASGHQVRVAYDGRQALAAAAAFAPNFAFLDIGMPGMNGYDLARALRRLPPLQRTVMVAVTGWGQQKDRERAMQAGFDAHLVKPVGFEQIEALLHR